MKTYRFAIIALFAFSAFLMTSCGNNEDREKIQEKHEDVMEIHDEVMPMMKDVRGLKADLTAKAEELSKNDSLNQYDNTVREMKIIIQQLEEADEAMMTWMRAYDKPTKDDEVNEALQYLENQEEKVRTVKSKILNSVEVAENQLKAIDELIENNQAKAEDDAEMEMDEMDTEVK